MKRLKPQEEEKKAKHIVQFRGPLKIVAKPSETTFKLASHFKSKEPRFKGTSPRTWTIWAEGFSRLVAVRGIELNSQGFLNTNSKQLVKGMSKRFHLKRF